MMGSESSAGDEGGAVFGVAERSATGMPLSDCQSQFHLGSGAMQKRLTLALDPDPIFTGAYVWRSREMDRLESSIFVRYHGNLTGNREKLTQKTASVLVSFMEKGFYPS
jgi:hypothetical protein